MLSVVTFPEDLFYPVGVHTVGVFVKKGVAQGASRVLWFRAVNDGRLKKKGKRLENPKAQNDYPLISPVLKSFFSGKTVDIPSYPAFQNVTFVNWDDADLELVPEAYLDEPGASSDDIAESIDQLMRESIAFRIQFKTQLDGLAKK